MSREESHLGDPPDDLSGFPRVPVDPGQELKRVAETVNGTWWFSVGPGGRFNLPSGSAYGTCYLATDEIGAIRETFEGAKAVEPDAIANKEVRTVNAPDDKALADTTDLAAAPYGINKEIGASTSYEKTRKWAHRWHESGFDGILHLLRHDPRLIAGGVSMFGPSGRRHTWPPGEDVKWDDGTSAPLTPELMLEAGIIVEPLPISGAITVAP